MSDRSRLGNFLQLDNRESRPEEFFKTHVFEPGGKAEHQLRLWVSASSSEYMLKATFLRRPRIWMLTGQYLLKDTQVLHVISSKQQGSISTGALAVGALTGVPVGGSINISPDTSFEAKLRTPEELVWAAQFCRLKTSHIKVRSGEAPMLPRAIAIHPNALRTGSVVRGEADQCTFAQVAIDNAVSGAVSDPMEETDDAEDNVTYEIVLKDAVERFETYFGVEES